jgi:hypothetical protein
MLGKKRVITALAGLLALSALAAGDAAAYVVPYDDNYSDHPIGDKRTKPYYQAVFVGRRLVIHLTGPDGIFHNDKNEGPGGEVLLGLRRTPMSDGIARFAVKYGKGPHHEARIVIHFRKNFSGEARLRYDVASGHDRHHVTHSHLHFYVGGGCGNVSCT